MRLYLSFPEPRSAETPPTAAPTRNASTPAARFAAANPAAVRPSPSAAVETVSTANEENVVKAPQNPDDSQERRFRADRRGEEGAEREAPERVDGQDRPAPLDTEANHVSRHCAARPAETHEDEREQGIGHTRPPTNRPAAAARKAGGVAHGDVGGASSRPERHGVANEGAVRGERGKHAGADEQPRSVARGACD